jgi:hypothetical protein
MSWGWHLTQFMAIIGIPRKVEQKFKTFSRPIITHIIRSQMLKKIGIQVNLN